MGKDRGSWPHLPGSSWCLRTGGLSCLWESTRPELLRAGDLVAMGSLGPRSRDWSLQVCAGQSKHSTVGEAGKRDLSSLGRKPRALMCQAACGPSQALPRRTSPPEQGSSMSTRGSWPGRPRLGCLDLAVAWHWELPSWACLLTCKTRMTLPHRGDGTLGRPALEGGWLSAPLPQGRCQGHSLSTCLKGPSTRQSLRGEAQQPWRKMLVLGSSGGRKGGQGELPEMV